jgi:hypothetical protein
MMLPAEAAEACLRCHGGVSGEAQKLMAPGAASKVRSLRADFAKPYRHPILTSTMHRRDEALPERNPNAQRHVGCLDCHDAHRTRAIEPSDELGTRVKASTLRGVSFEYELCYRCHGDSANLPYNSRNIRREMATTNASYHPVEGPGRRRQVPSLRSPLSASSVIACTDCHGSDDVESRGPHGSVYPGILVAAYGTRDDQIEGLVTYALCYRCHERNSILANESFPEHRSHLLEEKTRTSCFTCHNSHGSPDNPFLMDFNPVVVSPTSGGLLSYRSTGTRRGECYLTCHGSEHNPGRYCPPEEPCDPGEIGPASLDPTSLERPRGFSPFDQMPPLFPEK